MPAPPQKKTEIFKFFCLHTSVWVKSVFSLGKKPILRRAIGFFPGEMLTLLVLQKFVNTIRLSGLSGFVGLYAYPIAGYGDACMPDDSNEAWGMLFESEAWPPPFRVK